MKRLVILLALPFLFTCSAAIAQKPTAAGLGLNAVGSSGELKITPDMWFYDQELRRHKDPKEMVRAKAEYRAWQRTKRLAAMRWFGFSNSRPQASADPFNGDYSPRWTANPGYYPYRWNGV
ncbi:MAG: hypothetical protein GX594_02820, partial [Pirellulaceae bacterium]|nr:hypothetical protein [Pirellulaceae bacterium]